ncbi:hypothetical protein [Paenibacillus polymyxa]|uniref:hypothetical protein n=1 Tax=Paenibacillus polymyxa TaxID=1406 RepID=UPI000AB276CC|nr:hypothetical protein [Paenibacillus polymyxa]
MPLLKQHLKKWEGSWGFTVYHIAFGRTGHLEKACLEYNVKTKAVLATEAQLE